MKRGRFEPEITDTIEAVPATIEQYDLVTETGALVTTATAPEDVFGVAMDGASAGDPVAVVRRGFCPVNKADGESIAQHDILVRSATAGKVAVLAAAGGGTDVALARAEEANAVDGVRTGAYVDLISLDRTVTIPT